MDSEGVYILCLLLPNPTFHAHVNGDVTAHNPTCRHVPCIAKAIRTGACVRYEDLTKVASVQLRHTTRRHSMVIALVMFCEVSAPYARHDAMLNV
jgi:hypothetical protein